MNVLEIVQQALDEMGLPVPASIVSTTNDGQRQAKAILMAAARALRSKRTWPQLKKKHTFDTEENRSLYPLPSDYFSALLGTQWDEDGQLRLLAVSDAEMTDRTIGTVGDETRHAFRIFGPDINPVSSGGQFQIDPAGTSTATTLSFEYVSKNMFVTSNYATYKEILTLDTDLCLFDDDLMVAEFKWRYLSAKKKDYSQEKDDADSMIDKAATRLAGPFIGSFAGTGSSPRDSIPRKGWSFS